MNYNAFDPTASVHDAFLAYLNSLNGDGYPHLVEKIGIAFSTSAPNPNSGLWAKIEVAGLKEFNFVLTAEDLGPGSYLPPLNVDNTILPFVSAFYKVWVKVTQYQNPTFIPHASALDMVNGASKFDRVIIPSVTGFHDVVPAEIVGPIVHALMRNVYIQNKVYDKPVARTVAGERIWAGRNVTPTVPPGDVMIKPPARINFRASTEIRLKDGFVIVPGSEFSALIGAVNDYLECH